jgi:hypothetical protein
MNNTHDWRDIKYQETFNDEIRGLTRRVQSDPACKIEDLEGILKNIYIMEGAGQDGPGEVQCILISARIAAYESFIEKWRCELDKTVF